MNQVLKIEKKQQKLQEFSPYQEAVSIFKSSLKKEFKGYKFRLTLSYGLVYLCSPEVVCLSKENLEKLSQLNWFVNEETDCWCTDLRT